MVAWFLLNPILLKRFMLHYLLSSCLLLMSSQNFLHEKGFLLAPHYLSKQENILLRILKAHLITLPPLTHKKFYKRDKSKHSFCAYHRVSSHSTSDYKVLKNKMKQLLDFGVIAHLFVDAPTSSSNDK